MKRVVITGQGTINSLGYNVSDTNLALKSGNTGIQKLDLNNCELLRVNIGAQVSVDQQQSQPISWRLTVQGPRGKLFERDDRAGALSVGAREARQEAMSNMIQKITRW